MPNKQTPVILMKPELTPKISEHPHASDEALAECTADEIASALKNAIDLRGRATLVVSGGRSPVPMFQILSKKDLPWERVTVTLVDDRLVDPDSIESNELTVRRNLLVGPASASRFIPLVDRFGEAKAPCFNASELAELSREPFDVTVMGLGPDGHTASWFPDSPAIDECLRSSSPCTLLASSSARTRRITMTPAAVLNSRLIVLQFSGAEKHEVYRRARNQGPLEELPVRAILQQNAAPVSVHFSS
ncbi:6-phosphogluconolactonase [Noviherbaspirillum sp. CPCC 100848]|uniref:6-phosphogluconolactonase n=1 Tax=Noviherbaspirillum album TaxID=3080276 RepID=A0ABU6JI43_9BURK|nr:6-phosphogluconolactonase [Noviherbaspirillum sp. CPCC 100848]MEC4723347.1 6-phosphogluconolactonase [Noviherbaspirillum sp. CPCC 100848]